MWAKKTKISRGTEQGCGGVTSDRNGGVLCCKDADGPKAAVVPTPIDVPTTPPTDPTAASGDPTGPTGAVDAKKPDEAKADEKQPEEKQPAEKEG